MNLSHSPRDSHRPSPQHRVRWFLSSALLLAGALLATPRAAASQPFATQAPPSHAPQSRAPESEALRDGFHFALGVGSASVSATCASCDLSFFDGRVNGFSGALQIGGALTPQLVVAGEFFGWVKNDAPIYRRVAALSLVVLGYPSETSGFFIKGGVGGLRAIVENDLVRGTTNTYTAQTGIGYDIPLGDVAFTPYVNYVRTFYGETDFNGIISPEAIFPNAIQIGAALTIH